MYQRQQNALYPNGGKFSRMRAILNFYRALSIFINWKIILLGFMILFAHYTKVMCLLIKKKKINQCCALVFPPTKKKKKIIISVAPLCSLLQKKNNNECCALVFPPTKKKKWVLRPCVPSYKKNNNNNECCALVFPPTGEREGPGDGDRQQGGGAGVHDTEEEGRPHRLATTATQT